jgi:hypothetical protein
VTNSLFTNLCSLLRLDAATCTVMGLALTVASGPIASVTAIPAGLLFYAGLSLFPIAAFMAAISGRAGQWPWAVWLVVAGNVGWTAASFLLLLGGVIQPNGLGVAFIAGQALAVAALAALEYGALNRSAGASYAGGVTAA